MLIIPAIDLKDGRCVRLLKGEEGTETVFSENPAEIARKWQSLGAQWIHVVDLDGAFTGNPKNSESIEQIVKSVTCEVQLGGGIRNLDTVARYIELGVSRVIIGTAAITDPDFVKDACNLYPGKIAVGLDTKNGRIAVRGWKEVVEEDTASVLTRLEEAGVPITIFTNVDRDGTMEGINLDSVKSFLDSSPMPVVASGGIARMQDLDKLSTLEPEGLTGVILGRSIYTGDIDLRAAIEKYS